MPAATFAAAWLACACSAGVSARSLRRGHRRRRPHRGVPRPGAALPVAGRLGHSGRADEPHPPPSRHRVRPVDSADRPRLDGRRFWPPARSRAAAGRILDSSLRYSVDKTTREILFLPLPADLKHRAKPFIDVTVDRFAKGLGAVLTLVLIQPWGFGLAWRQLSWVSLTVTALWVAGAVRARRQYLASFRQSIARQGVLPGEVRLSVADLSTVETRRRRLDAGRPGTPVGVAGRAAAPTGQPAGGARSGPSYGSPPLCAGRIVAGPGVPDVRNRGSHAVPAGRQARRWRPLESGASRHAQSAWDAPRRARRSPSRGWSASRHAQSAWDAPGCPLGTSFDLLTRVSCGCADHGDRR